METSNYSKWRMDFAEMIAAKAVEAFPDMGLDLESLKMDIEAADCEVGLNFWKLANADEGTFGHDVLGIRSYLNRRTGRLKDNFYPRCVCAQRPKGLPEYPDWFVPSSSRNS